MSEALGIKVDPDQIIMSQSPLEMFHEYHDKTVLVVGPEHDGGFFDVAQELGFENIVTLGIGLKRPELPILKIKYSVFENIRSSGLKLYSPGII